MQGPPGTGKTRTLLAFIQTLVMHPPRRQSRFLPILACADTNAAVDNIVEGLEGKGIRVVRLGQPAKVGRLVSRVRLPATPSVGRLVSRVSLPAPSLVGRIFSRVRLPAASLVGRLVSRVSLPGPSLVGRILGRVRPPATSVLGRLICRVSLPAPSFGGARFRQSQAACHLFDRPCFHSGLLQCLRCWGCYCAGGYQALGVGGHTVSACRGGASCQQSQSVVSPCKLLIAMFPICFALTPMQLWGALWRSITVMRFGQSANLAVLLRTPDLDRLSAQCLLPPCLLWTALAHMQLRAPLLTGLQANAACLACCTCPLRQKLPAHLGQVVCPCPCQASSKTWCT